MSAQAVALADAIVSRINTGTYSKYAVRAVRREVPILDAEQLTDLTVSVFTGSMTVEPLTRSSFERTYKPIVAIQKRLTPGVDEPQAQAESDKFQATVEEIDARLANADLAGLSFDAFEDEERPSYGPVPLMENKILTAAIGLQYVS